MCGLNVLCECSVFATALQKSEGYEEEDGELLRILAKTSGDLGAAREALAK